MTRAGIHHIASARIYVIRPADFIQFFQLKIADSFFDIFIHHNSTSRHSRKTLLGFFLFSVLRVSW